MPRGVHGRRPNSRRAGCPDVLGWKPSAVLRGSMRWISRRASGMPGRGNCTGMPCVRIGVQPVDQRQQFGLGRAFGQVKKSNARMPTLVRGRPCCAR